MIELQRGQKLRVAVLVAHRFVGPLAIGYRLSRNEPSSDMARRLVSDKWCTGN